MREASYSGWCGLVLLGVIGATGGLLPACDDSAGEVVKDASSDAPEGDAGGDASSVAVDDFGMAAGNGLRPEGVAHCYTPFSGAHEATLQFWATFRAAALDQRAAATAGLAAAAREFPEEEEFALLSGLANLWRVAEPSPEEVDDMTGFIFAALNARSDLERAYELCPTDHRIPAWLGPILVNQGRSLMDDATVQEGLSILQKGIDHYPAFVLFSKLLVYADRPRDDPSFQAALDAITANIAACRPSDPACSNHPHVAHNIEGAAVFMGDAFTKAGDEVRARESYALVEDSPNVADWDYHELLQNRLDTMEQRAAAWADTDPDNDPIAAWTSNYQCSICHKQ